MQLIHFVNKSRAFCKQCNKKTSLKVLDYHVDKRGVLFAKVLCPLCKAQYTDTVDFNKLWESTKGGKYLELSTTKRRCKDSLSEEVLWF